MGNGTVVDLNRFRATRGLPSNVARESQQLSLVTVERACEIGNWIFNNYKFGPGVVQKFSEGWTIKRSGYLIEMSAPISLFSLSTSKPSLAHFFVSVGSDGRPVEAKAVMFDKGITEIYGEAPSFANFQPGTHTPVIFPELTLVKSSGDVRAYSNWALKEYCAGDVDEGPWFFTEHVDSVTLNTVVNSQGGKKYCFEIIFDEDGEPFATYKTAHPLIDKHSRYDVNLEPPSMDKFKEGSAVFNILDHID